MRFFLFGLSILAFLAGATIMSAAKSAIHEIEAFLLWIDGSILLCGAAVLDSLNQIRRSLPQPPQPVPRIHIPGRAEVLVDAADKAINSAEKAVVGAAKGIAGTVATAAGVAAKLRPKIPIRPKKKVFECSACGATLEFDLEENTEPGSSSRCPACGEELFFA